MREQDLARLEALLAESMDLLAEWQEHMAERPCDHHANETKRHWAEGHARLYHRFAALKERLQEETP